MSNVKPVRNLKNAWIVVDKKGVTRNWTLSYFRSLAIDNFIAQSFSGNWDEAKKNGFRVAKVNVTFEEVPSKKQPLVMLAEYDHEVNAVIVSGEAETN